MQLTSSPPAAFAPLHDELVHEATLALREALARLESSRQPAAAQDTADARLEAIALVDEARQLLRRAELAAVGIRETHPPR